MTAYEAAAHCTGEVLPQVYLTAQTALLPFIPTCSEYALEALQKYGALKGSWLAIKRICRCHPFHTGEHEFYDPVP